MKPANKLVMVTCYDATFARICVEAKSFDYILVGDSLGMVISGEDNTTHVSMQAILHHVSAVSKGIEKYASNPRPKLIGDMPIGSYETVDMAIEYAKKLIEAGADLVKLEGPVTDVVRALVAKGITVCGHIGFTPQSIPRPKVQGRSPEDAELLRMQARDLEMAGCDLLVLELIPSPLAKLITESVLIPTIGIGAGKECDGQVLVLYDLLGLNPDFKPKFLKTYANGYSMVSEALKSYSNEVKDLNFPSEKNSFH